MYADALRRTLRKSLRAYIQFLKMFSLTDISDKDRVNVGGLIYINLIVTNPKIKVTKTIKNDTRKTVVNDKPINLAED